ncbi:MAG: 16S rRNA (guanine(527)-N(7))-methyltransferase RsmG [Puniceicoccales bacterium]|jgi:16S rRNA (guanine527-N7)-methyltransferase|nr:16S rRNA (guanine(527)-N(7))-methyltransferase RsmG [Puniceicoccales bacterium]
MGEIFWELGDEKIAALEKYAELLTQWNAKINLVSRKDVLNVIVRHIVPCLSLARIADFSAGESVLDLGTGGGLPGIPLAIAKGDVNFTLVDSIYKKILAVSAMIRSLALKNARAVTVRAEDLTEKFDKIVARAVTNLGDFLKYSRRLLVPGGKIFYLKGGDCAADLELLADLKLSKACALHSLEETTGIGALADKVVLEIICQ